ncbi:MAG: M20/M25/M40 family metallo-hydrolase [Gemmatimonas sp.]
MTETASQRRRAAANSVLITTTRRAFATAVLLTAPSLLLAQTADPGRGGAGRGATPAGPPSTDIYLVPLTPGGAALPKVGAPLNVTHRDGYDNQPSFSNDSKYLFYTSTRADAQSDIYRYDFSTGLAIPVQKTMESEYSAFPTVNDDGVTVIRVEADSTQRLWRMPNSGAPSVMFPSVKPVGYFAQADDSTWALFVLGSPATLQIAHTNREGTETVARNIGRSLLRIPGSKRVSFVQKGAEGWFVMSFDPATKKIDTLVATVSKTSEDVVWADSTTLLSANGTKLFAWKKGTTAWTEIGDFAYASLGNITRLAVSPGGRGGQMLAIAAVPQKRPAAVPSRAYPEDKIDPKSIQRGIDILAGDAMEGRRAGSPGSTRAAQWLMEQFKSVGLTPGGDSGTYLQNIPIELVAAVNIPGANAGRGGGGSSQPRPRALQSWAAWDTLPAERRVKGSNVVGILKGSDPTLGEEVVLVTAHYDHLGISRPIDGDSINNGADDDASGCISLIEMARALQKGPRPKRTIMFVAITGEEVGGIGTSWYLAHPIRPLANTVVDLNMEMIARPDSLVGGFGKAWLTGYERSTMGDLLSANAMDLVPDLRPGQQFFNRSDNIGFARAGIPAHTISSFNLHPDYHTVRDNPNTVDAAHMANVISQTARALRFLADGPRPTWHPGGQPPAPQPRAQPPRGN